MMRMPQIPTRSNKIATRRRILRDEPVVVASPRRSASATYIVCSDGELIRIDDPDDLARIRAYDDVNISDWSGADQTT